MSLLHLVVARHAGLDKRICLNGQVTSSIARSQGNGKEATEATTRKHKFKVGGSPLLHGRPPAITLSPLSPLPFTWGPPPPSPL